jgi:hypothetical protein
MNVKDWQPIVTFNNSNVDLPAVWFKVADHVSAGKVLKFSATGQWSFLPDLGKKCGPDGFLGFPLPYEKLLVPTTPLGALIGKLGGSTADQKDGTLFTIGSFTVVVAPDKSGPLYIGINAAPGAPISRLDQLRLDVSIADP